MDDFYNTYFDNPYDEIIFEEEDFKIELIIEKIDKYYNPKEKEKKKEKVQDKSDWRSYRFNNI